MATRLEQLIYYFVERVPGAGRTQLAKFLYLADHEARRYLGKPVSDLCYRWDDFGPFDQDILHGLNALQHNGFVEVERIAYPSGAEGYRYRSTGRPMASAPAFTDAQLAILNYVAVEFGSMPLRELLEDVVYQTRPMVDAKKRNAPGAPLRMELVDNEARQAGLELDRVWESWKQADRGEVRPIRKVMDELRALHHAASC